MNEDTVGQVQDWIDQIHHGDTGAENHLLGYVRDRWLGLARRALHGSHRRLEAYEQTDDVLSELCLRLLQDWKRGAVPTSATDFFRQVSNNFGHALVDLCRRHHGRNVPRPRRLSLESPGSGPRHEPGTDTLDPGRLTEWEVFHEQVTSLPDDLREVFQLRWYHNLSAEEVARALGIGLRTVTKRWVEARLRLRTVLRDPVEGDCPG